MAKVYKSCPCCRRQHYMKLTTEQLGKLWEYERGGSLIQEKFPEMGSAEREFLKSGYCSKCQELIFGRGSDKILTS